MNATRFYNDRYLEFTDKELENLTTTELIATTFKIYGSIFALCFTVFLFLRAKFPSVYAFNSVQQGQVTEISKDRHGYITWIWKIFEYTDESIFECCGLSAVVYLRFLRLGLKLSAWGIFNSIFLIPVNVYGCRDETDACTGLVDGVNRASLGNVSSQNPSLIATTVAAYIIFGKAMQYIFREFRWFTIYRHKFCVKPRPDNYTVYVGHIPKIYRSDVALLEYFRSIFSHDDVLEAKIALDIPNLDKKVSHRKKVVEKLEYYLSVRSVKGYEPKPLRSLKTELQKLNDEISSVITQIENAKTEEKRKFLRDMLKANGFNFSTGNLSTGSGSHPRRTMNLRQRSKGSRNLMQGMSESDDDADGDDEEKNRFPVRKDEYVIVTPSDSTVDNTTVLDTTLHLEEEDLEEVVPRTHCKSPTSDTIETNTLMAPYSERLPFLEDGLIDIDTSLVIEEGAELTPLTKKRKTPLDKDHKRSITFGSIGTVTTKTLGSAKKSMKVMGKSVGSVGRTVGKQVENAGRNVGKNVHYAYEKTVGNIGKTMANTKMGKTLADTVNQSAVVMKKVAGQTVKKSVVSVKDLAIHSAHLATKASKRMTRLLISGEDGEVLESGFVTFTNLSTKAQCAQIIHHQKPFKFHVKDAPLPENVIWANIGRSHEELQFGYLMAQAATVGLMIFWTIPVAFFTSLSEAESLQDVIPSLENIIKENPWVARFLAQLSPILLVILTALLPVILSIICHYEGHIGINSLQASLLTKLASFMIVQIFFVQAISGSIFDQLNEMMRRPSEIVNLLATSIPTQVKSFIQFVLVQMFLGCSIEILRVIRVAMAFARSRLGPNLTEKERSKAFMFLQPITVPDEMEYPMLYSEMALYFMVNLIYSCIAPVMSYFMLITFMILSLVYRHQLVYIYTSKSDKGGKLWPCMINLLLVSILISEVTLIGIMSIKKGAVAAALLIPLLIVTILFVFYIKQEHFRVTEFVPSTICKEEDIKNHGTLDISFLQNAYLQPSLQLKYEYPETDLTMYEGRNARLPDNFEIGDEVLDQPEERCDIWLPDKIEVAHKVFDQTEVGDIPLDQSGEGNNVRHHHAEMNTTSSVNCIEDHDITSDIPYEERIKLADNVEHLPDNEKATYEKSESDAFYSCKEQDITEHDPLDESGLNVSSSHTKSSELQDCNQDLSCTIVVEEEPLK